MALDRVMNKYFETALFLKLRITLYVQFKWMAYFSENDHLPFVQCQVLPRSHAFDTQSKQSDSTVQYSSERAYLVVCGMDLASDLKALSANPTL